MKKSLLVLSGIVLIMLLVKAVIAQVPIDYLPLSRNSGQAISPSMLPYWRLALGRVRAGQQGGAITNAKILFIGDSTTVGACATFGTAGGCTNGTQNNIPQSYPTQIANMFAGDGVPASWSNWFGGQGGPHAGAQTVANDARINTNGQWGCNGLALTIGGCFTFQTTSMGAALLTFTPTQPVDTFKVYIATNTGEGTFATNVDGGTEFDVAGTTASTGMATLTVAASSVGIHSFNMARKAGASSSNNVAGVESWDSTKSQVIVDNAGWSGSQSVDWANTGAGAWNTGNSTVYNLIAPDLAVIDLGINDWDNSISEATYMANIQTLINAIRAGHAATDIILVVPVPTNTANASLAKQYTIRTGIYGVAQANNLPVVDITERWGTYTAAHAIGYYGDNFTHPNGPGYADVAYAVYSAIGRQ